MISTTGKRAVFILAGIGFVSCGVLLVLRGVRVESPWGMFSADPMILMGLAFLAAGVFGKKPWTTKYS
jgi:hypothetical protein